MSTEKIGAGASTVRPINASYLLLGFALRPAVMHSCHDTAVGNLNSGWMLLKLPSLWAQMEGLNDGLST